MSSKTLVVLIIFFNFFSNINADEKQSIINNLIKTNNMTFSFKQITREKVETGYCVLVFDNKLRCSYEDKLQKEIIINDKTLVVMQKRYNKKFFYPISKSMFLNILNKNNLINLIHKSNLIVNDNIELIYLDENGKKMKIFFQGKNYELIGWWVEDKFQNEIFFSLKIDKINTKIADKNFKIPSVN